MSVARPFTNLNIFDIISNLVPGAIFLSVVGGLFTVEMIISLDPVATAGVLIFGGYIIGHVFQALGSRLFSEYDISDVITVRSDESKSLEELGFSQPDIVKGFEKLVSHRFGLQPSSDFPDAINQLVLSELELKTDSRALRFQIFYYFFRSMVLVSVGSIILSLISVGFIIFSITGSRHLLLSASILIAALVLIALFYPRMHKFNKLFVTYAVAEFYALETKSSNPISKGS